MGFAAVTLVRPKDLTITSIPEVPPALNEDEVLVKVDRVSLCGSDYRLFNGTYNCPVTYPIRFGHEWSGTVLDVGPDVTRVEEGDRVTGDCSKWCGLCANCQTDRNLCKRIEKFGITVDGFSSTIVVVPAKYLYRDKYYLPHAVLALTEAFAVALHAIHRLGKPPLEPVGSRTLIIGCGPLGIALYMLLTLHYRWRRVEVYDPVDERLEFLRRVFPNKMVFDKPALPTNATSMNYMGLYHDSPYSIIFEAAGQPEALQLAMDAVMPRGVIVSLGLPASSTYDLSRVAIKSLSLLGSIGGSGEFDTVLDFFSMHAEEAQQLVTATYDFCHSRDAFVEGQDRTKHLKVQIRFDGVGC